MQHPMIRAAKRYLERQKPDTMALNAVERLIRRAISQNGEASAVRYAPALDTLARLRAHLRETLKPSKEQRAAIATLLSDIDRAVIPVHKYLDAIDYYRAFMTPQPDAQAVQVARNLIARLTDASAFIRRALTSTNDASKALEALKKYEALWQLGVWSALSQYQPRPQTPAAAQVEMPLAKAVETARNAARLAARRVIPLYKPAKLTAEARQLWKQLISQLDK